MRPRSRGAVPLRRLGRTPPSPQRWSPQPRPRRRHRPHPPPDGRQFLFFRDVGLYGLAPDGRRDPSFNGEQAFRNKLFADLLVTTGLRLREAAALTRLEIPAPSKRAARLAIAGPTAKRGKPRDVLVPAAVADRLRFYLRGSRAEIVERHGARSLAADEIAISVDGHDIRTGRSRVDLSLVDPERRWRMVEQGPSGVDPLALFLGRGARPVRPQAWERVFEAASARCAGFGAVTLPQVGRVTPHMLRHTFAVIAADEPFAEIAVGWQLKHAANRILTTQAHLDREGTGWDTDIATEQTRSAIDALYESFTGYLDGGTIAGGGGARRAAFFDGIAAEVAERFPGQTGDDEIIKPFLRTAGQSFYPGTLNDCAFDASLARCLTSVEPSDRSTPVLSACQPGRCPNATIEEKHRPVWAAARGRLADLLERKDLSEPKRALLDAELAEVDRTISTIKEPDSDGDR